MKQLILSVVVMVSAISTAGCAGFSQAVAAREKSDKVAVLAANDNIVEGIKDATCALPYGTLLRHPEMQPAAQSICGTVNNASTLLPSAGAGAQ